MTDATASVFIVDDDRGIRNLLGDFLKRHHYDVTLFESAFQVLQKIQNQPLRPNCIISDINLPDLNGLDLLQRLKASHLDISMIFITAHASVESAVRAIRLGADDYIIKPFSLEDVRLKIEKTMEIQNLREDNRILRTTMKTQWTSGKIIGKSLPMRELFDLVSRVSGVTANLLISGESGSGKEVVARAVHDQSPRSKMPFIAINCAAIPDQLLESELFGHAKGAFTGALHRKFGLFEEANGGTLFLDEIGDMAPALQSKLLRVIQERRIRPVGDNQTKEIDVRLIAATHQDLKQSIKEKKFREDLYYRLSVIPIHVPPLRERREDIPLLTEHFLKKYSAMNRKPISTVSPQALAILGSHPWNGNVRELENTMERAIVLCQSDRITEKDLSFLNQTEKRSETQEDFVDDLVAKLPTLRDLEKRYIQYVLNQTNGKKSQAAEILGVNRRTVYRHGKSLVTRKSPEKGFEKTEGTIREIIQNPTRGARLTSTEEVLFEQNLQN